MTYTQYLKEEKQPLSCLMATIPESDAKAILEFGEKIPKENLYTDEEGFGLEKKCHTTVFYGMHDQSPEASFEHIKEPIKIQLKTVTVFECDKYDVLKIDVESKDLRKLHKEIKDNLEATITFPNFSPHITIGYIKKGTCKELLKDKAFSGQEIEISDFVFSNGNKEVFDYDVNL